VAALAVGVISGGGMAQAAASSRVTAGVTAIQLAAAGPQAVTARASATCAPSLNHFNRTQACWNAGGTVTLFKNTTPEGTISFTITQYLHTSATSRNFTEHIAISGVRTTGAATGVHMTLQVTCGSPCSVANHFPQGRTVSAMSGNISYHDSIGKGKVHSTKSKYVFGFTKAGFTPGSFSYNSPLSYRCDQAFGPSAGCVFPAYTPFLASLAPLTNIAKNITKAQAGPGHYGRPGSGHPLHHITSTAQQRANYNAVCARSVVGPAPAGKSCDEYPFKTTKEGGKTLSAANRHTAWVPTAEQNSQGGRITAFYNANRVLNGDPFWVVV
jgi:hypothetical protein